VTWTWQQKETSCYKQPVSRTVEWKNCTVDPSPSACNCNISSPIPGISVCFITQCIYGLPTDLTLPVSSNQTNAIAIFNNAFLTSTYNQTQCVPITSLLRSDGFSTGACLLDPSGLFSVRYYCKPAYSYYYSYYYSYSYYYYYTPQQIITYTYGDYQCKQQQSKASQTVGCILVNGTQLSRQYSCKATCFHADTEITYKGKQFPIAKLEQNAELRKHCVVPHVVRADGVRITTKCKGSRALRVTDDHLVYTQKGLVAAASIQIGDFLIGEQGHCEVSSLKQEHEQEYYGLNCEESVVFANGYQTSAFGRYHTLPAFWMKWVSKLVGVESASYYGDAIANLFFAVIPH